MHDILLLQLTLSFYVIALLLDLLRFFVNAKAVFRFSFIFSSVGFVLHNMAIILRWLLSGHVPLASFYESLIFLSWAIVLINLFIEIKYVRRDLRVFMLPLGSLMIAAALFSPLVSPRIEQLPPALQGGWLVIHAAACLIGFAAFAAAFALGLLHFIKKAVAGTKGLMLAAPSLLSINFWIYRFVRWGFLFLVVGIVTGSAWAYSAWGTYWSWDPKETCSLITLLVYAVMLHLRQTGWKQRNIPALLSIAGFILVLFTYWSSFIFNSLHNYN
ncbi:MAG TPA: cytochrome c biogenesis protein CcsA [Smithellaceae bacterium]|nr:cytochrome c biogenesis protein CcsA [Smithellaceae bacterium]